MPATVFSSESLAARIDELRTSDTVDLEAPTEATNNYWFMAKEGVSVEPLPGPSEG